MTPEEVVSNLRKRRLPSERKSITHRFEIEGGHKGYIVVGMYDDGKPGEIFIHMSKEGSTLSGLLDSFAVSTSLHLQNGVPLKSLVSKFANSRFEPYGLTGNSCIPQTTSIMDYIFRWLGMKFLSMDELREIGVLTKCHDCGKTVACSTSFYACTASPPQN